MVKDRRVCHMIAEVNDVRKSGILSYKRVSAGLANGYQGYPLG
jgi:hypothetical protein